MGIWEMSKLELVPDIIWGNMTFWIPHTLSLSRKPRICIFFLIWSLHFFLGHDHQLDNLPLYRPFGRVICPWKTTDKGNKALVLPFSFFLFFTGDTFPCLTPVTTTITLLGGLFFSVRGAFLLWEYSMIICSLLGYWTPLQFLSRVH